MTELFGNWCALNGINSLPVPPQIVARFVADIAPLGIVKVWPEVQDISRAHYTIGLADPTLGHPVTTAVNAISGIVPPRSWDKDHKSRFMSLPYDVQLYVNEREAQRDKAVRQAQQRAAEIVKGETNGIQQTAAA